MVFQLVGWGPNPHGYPRAATGSFAALSGNKPPLFCMQGARPDGFGSHGGGVSLSSEPGQRAALSSGVSEAASTFKEGGGGGGGVIR